MSKALTLVVAGLVAILIGVLGLTVLPGQLTTSSENAATIERDGGTPEEYGSR